MLKKEFNRKDVTRARNLIMGKSGASSETQVGYKKKRVDYKEGDTWKENGKTWTIKDGLKQTISKLDAIKKEVFVKMNDYYPELKYTSDQIVNGKSYSSDNCYDLFCAGIYETNGVKRYLSEDYYFSRLWQECGGDIWADIAMPLTHFGNRAFKGHVGSLFARKK